MLDYAHTGDHDVIGSLVPRPHPLQSRPCHDHTGPRPQGDRISSVCHVHERPCPHGTLRPHPLPTKAMSIPRPCTHVAIPTENNTHPGTRTLKSPPGPHFHSCTRGHTLISSWGPQPIPGTIPLENERVRRRSYADPAHL